MIAKTYCALLALVIAGCTTTPPQIVYTPVETKVPLPVPCKIVAPDVPHWALNDVPAGADIYTKGRALVAELQQRIGYETELLSAVASCQ